MDALGFFGLVRARDDLHWSLPVVPQLCSGLGALFGGAGAGAAVEAMQRATGRPVVWSTVQYLSYARPPAVVDLAVTEIVRGHRSSQARVVATVDGEEIFTVVAALGSRETAFAGSWSAPPDVPKPDACPRRPPLPHLVGTINDRLEIRLADARPMEELPVHSTTGRSSLWVRVRDLELSAPALAIVGDYVPFGVIQLLGVDHEVNSLDNTLRVMHQRPITPPSSWVLADIHVHAVRDGFGHGMVHLWTEDGTLLATASQSTIVRARASERDDVRRAAEGTIEGGH
ncbi:MAG: thioesterase family protein [Acidimicrobiia bacterium]